MGRRLTTSAVCRMAARRYTRPIERIADSPPECCPSCSAERLGRFCHVCGQRWPEGRLTLGGLWRELPARVFNLERGLLHTFVEAWRRPGRTARDYVGGKRSPYVTPLTYFLVAAAVQLLALVVVGDTIREEVRERVDNDTRLIERFGESLGEEPGERFAELYFGLIQQAYTYLFFFFMSLPFALCLRFLARRLEPRYNLAEILVFSLYTTGHLVLVTGLIAPITGRIGSAVHSIISMLFYFGYTGFAARGFFDGGAKRVVLAWIALLFGLAIFFVALTMASGYLLTSQAAD